MSRFAALIALLLLAVSPPGSAQWAACGTQGIPLTVLGSGQPYLALGPTNPTATSTIEVTAGMTDYSPQITAAAVQDNVVTVTFTGSYMGWGTPPELSCSQTTLGPLPSGQYRVNFMLVDPSFVPPVPVLVATGALEVAPALAAVATPAMSNFAALVLMLLVLLGGLHAKFPAMKSRRLE
jgi:hypothetical protein